MTVAFAEQVKTATTGKDGKWRVNLDPLKADAAPREMVISDGAGYKVTLKDILVGGRTMSQPFRRKPRGRNDGDHPY